MLPIDITLINSIVVDSEWFVQDTLNPNPCLISYKSDSLPATVITPPTPLPEGYKYYVSFYVGAERTKIPLPEGGQWVCLASLNHLIYFDVIKKAEGLAAVYERLTGKVLDKNARDRFAKESSDFTDYTPHLGGGDNELYDSEIKYSCKDAEVTWEVLLKLLPQIQRMQPEVFYSIVAHSNMYTYSHPKIDDWISLQNQEFADYEKMFDEAVVELIDKTTPESCPQLDWSLMPKKKKPKWKNKKITVKTNEFGFLLGVRDKAGNRLVPRSKADGGWINGNCKLFSKDMIDLWEKGDIVADNPGADKILEAVIKMSFWLGICSNFAETFRWQKGPWNTSNHTYQDQTPVGAMTGRSTSKTCLLFPKNVAKDKIGFTARMVYHHLPQDVYQVGFDFSAQEALILGLICKSLGDARLYNRTTTGTLHDDNAHEWGITRSEAKAGFFAGVYGAGAARLASTIGMSLEAAQSVANGLYGRGGVCEVYLNWIHRNKHDPWSIYWEKPAPIKHAGVHLLKDWFVQSTGNAMLHCVVANLSTEGYQLSQTVHDELHYVVRSSYAKPWEDPAIVALSERMNHHYHQSWLHLAKKLRLPNSEVEKACFHAEVEITNRGLKYYHNKFDGELYEPVIVANPLAADRPTSKLGALAPEEIRNHKYRQFWD